MSYAAFILSTGRCGTQWIASTLSEQYGDRIHVTHEPLHNRYDARETLGLFSQLGLGDASSSLSSEVHKHLDFIEAQIIRRPYIECGHPCWSMIPYLAERFQGRIKIIHLTRHPVPTCYSWLTHGAFEIPLAPHLPEKILLSPFDKGIKFQEYREVWGRFTPFEKCFYYWTEVNAFALDQEKNISVPWLRLQYENLFAADGLAYLLDFLDLPASKDILNFRFQVVDQFRYVTSMIPDWQVIRKHFRALSIAETLGYALRGIDTEKLARRYLDGESV